MRPLRKRWANEELQEIAFKYTKRGHFRKFDKNAYDVAKRRKILDQICSHMDPPKTKAIPLKKTTTNSS
jgi:hypothetical protein